MSRVACELIAVTKLNFVADAYPYKDDETIVVVLKSPLRESLPYERAVLTFKANNFTEAAVVEAYEREVVHFLAETLRTAKRLLAKPVQPKLTLQAPLCLN